MKARGKGKSPWHQGAEYEIDDGQLATVAAIAAAAADKRTAMSPKPDAAYQYDKWVMEAIGPHLPEDDDVCHAFLHALERTLQQLAHIIHKASGDKYRNWHEGHEAAQRSVGCNLAWSTPGFAEARRISDQRNENG